MSPEAQTTGKDVIGHWEGEMVREGAGLPVDYDFYENAGSIEGRFSCATQRVMEYPLDAVRYAHPQLHFELGGEIIFDGKLAGDIITGTFRTGGSQGTFALRRTPPPKLPYDVDEVRFNNGDVTLSGTLLRPSRQGPWTAIVFLHGSGPESRWGTSRFLADRFARRGIAALIYDKRGIGASTGDWRHASFGDLTDDAVAALRFLKGQPGIDGGRMGIHGHSQVYGERDSLVNPAESAIKIEQALQKAGNQDYTILLLPRAEHNLTIQAEPGQPFMWWHVAPGLPDLLTAWVKQRVSC